MNYRTTWKRLCSGLLLMAVLLTLLPTWAFASGYEDHKDAGIVAIHKKMSSDNTSVTNESLASTALGTADRLNPPYSVSAQPFERDGDTINVWVTSSDMTEEEKSGYSVVPYVFDTDGNKWYLYQIMWANNTSVGDDVTTGMVMTCQEIIDADSQDDYQFDLRRITADPKSSTNKYSIRYCWTTTEPEDWGNPSTPKDTYSIQYEPNISGVAIYGYKDEFWDGGDNGISGMVVNPSATTVEEYRKFLVGDQNYQTYFAVKKEAAGNTYYEFTGWQDSSRTVHDPGEIVTANSSLAENGVITLTAQWEEITPLTNEELQENSGLPITVFNTGSDIIGQALITQWTDTDANTQYNDNTADPVTLDKDGTISYLVSAKINSGLTSVSDENAMQYSSDFAKFTFHVKVDSQLKFARLDGKGEATLTFESTILKPTETNFTSTIIDNEDGTYSITFEPSTVHVDSDGNMDIQITTQWVDGKHSSADLTKSIRLTGLDFQLKDKVTDPKTFKVETSANITGTMDMKNKIPGNFRAYYRVANGLLRGSTEWQTAFKGTNSDPTALIHALQYMDYKLKEIDLANDPMIGQLNANTVTATYPGTVTITPADITIYMGGDGGYDAVVGEGGGTTSSNSLPHPLFKIKAPAGIDPENLTFTNGNKTWMVISDGNGYYHFSEGQRQDKVRVTYTDTEGHKYISDSFDPTTVDDVYTTFQIDLYPGKNDMSQVRAVADNGVHYVASESGTLTVRAVADDDPTSDIVTDAPTEKIASGKAVAVEPSGTTYTLNNTGVKLPADSKPSLLFDSIIEDSPESTDRTDALKDKVNETLGAVATNATRHYEIKYLDLVDANNGNAWITSSAGTDIYWGYPAGTDENTEFYVLHFKDLHRDGENSGFEIADINGCEVEKLTAENNSLEKTEQGIKFHVGAGGFSPFALVYDTVNTYTITATAGENGSISPSGEFTVTAGEDQTFTITPDRGYHIQDVLVDGASVGAVSSYTFADVAANHTIKATFAKDADPVTRYRIEASAGEGGSISPEGIVRVSQGGSQTFTITPDEGYKIEDVLVDGESAGPVSEYTFKNVRAWHTITVTFAKLPADPGDTGVSDWLDTEHHMAYLNGYPGQVFGPDRDMTRAEAAQMFYNLLLDKDVAGTASFTDVAADAWYAKAVNTLASLGMIQGVEGHRFQPDRAITRAEFTAMAMRFTHGETTGENRFSDVNPDQWFYDVVVGAVQYGWINGYEDGTFRPESTIKRAEVAAITNRMLARAADEAYVDAHASQLRLFADVAKDHWAYYTIVEASNTHDYQTNHGNETWKDA